MDPKSATKFSPFSPEAKAARAAREAARDQEFENLKAAAREHNLATWRGWNDTPLEQVFCEQGFTKKGNHWTRGHEKYFQGSAAPGTWILMDDDKMTEIRSRGACSLAAQLTAGDKTDKRAVRDYFQSRGYPPLVSAVDLMRAARSKPAGDQGPQISADEKAVIDRHKKDLYAIPVEEVLAAWPDQARARQIVGRPGKAGGWHDNATGRQGAGAVDLAKNLRDDRDFGRAALWLAEHLRPEIQADLAAARGFQPPQAQAAPAQAPAPGEAVEDGKELQLPEPGTAFQWQAARKYLVEDRGLDGRLVDALRDQGLLGVTRSRGQDCPVFFFMTADGEVRGADTKFPRPVEGEDGPQKCATAPGTDKRGSAFWFYHGSNVSPVSKIYMTEAAVDAMALASYLPRDEPVIIASIGGTPTHDRPAWLDDLMQHETRHVVAALDNDERGREFTDKIRRKWHLQNMEELTVPAGHKDWNDALRAGAAFELPRPRPRSRIGALIDAAGTPAPTWLGLGRGASPSR